MIKLDEYVVLENNIFYFDLEEYNQANSDLPIDETDSIRFQYENQKYMGKVFSCGSLKNKIFTIQVIKKIDK
jgi:hypothetical protein